jgi:hypothetical protein
VAEIRNAGSRNKTHIARANHRNPHIVLSFGVARPSGDRIASFGRLRAEAMRCGQRGLRRESLQTVACRIEQGSVSGVRKLGF